jgi:SLIT-ROBO Rho GTPase activating protein
MVIISTDVRQQLTEQLRCLDQRVDCHLGLVWELQEYYRRHAEVEAELSRGLDKLGKQIMARHRAEKQR